MSPFATGAPFVPTLTRGAINCRALFHVYHPKLCKTIILACLIPILEGTGCGRRVGSNPAVVVEIVKYKCALRRQKQENERLFWKK